MMDQDLLEQLSKQADGILNELDPIIARWTEGENPNSETINIVFRGLHTIKGGFGFFGLENIKHLAHALEDDLSEVRDMVINLTSEHAQRCGKAMMTLRSLCSDPGNSDEVDLTEMFKMLNFFHNQGTMEEIEEFESRWPLEANERQCRQALKQSRSIIRITMRTKADIEDQGLNLLDMNDMLTALGNPLAVAVGIDEIGGIDDCLSMDLKYQVLFMTIVSLEDLALTLGVEEECCEVINLEKILQAAEGSGLPVTGLEYLLRSIAKVSSELANRLQKKVMIHINSEDITLEAAQRLALQSCLIHLLRNALDHGIELPDQRLAVKKAETGQITLTAKLVDEQLLLSIADDGAGINQERVLGIAVAKGIVSADQVFDDENEIFMLLFEPGFSTCETVSEVSGRGVGMDVVKSEITELGGHLSVSSVLGQGTIFNISLPLDAPAASLSA